VPSGYWRLTETGGTIAHDTSGNGRHATYVVSSGALDRPGVVGADTSVSGVGGVIAEAGDVLDHVGTAAFSLEAWVKPTVADSQSRRVISKELTDAAGRQGWSLSLQQGALRFERSRDGVVDVASGGSVPIDQWSHVAARFSGGTMRVFVNGEEVGSMSTTRALLDTTAVLKLGDGFSGLMTHAAVYPVSLSTDVLLRHYRDGGIGYAATGTLYYGATETRANPCATGTSAVQSALARATIEPDPDAWSSGIGRSEETVYDVMGRPVATRVNAESWSCTTYDSRGRPTMQTVPSYGAEPGRTITYNYAVGGDPLTTSVGDSAGTVTTRVDLLGRVVSYTDVWAKVTTTAYDQAGRVTQTNGPAGQLGTDYQSDGRVDAQRRGGSIIADPAYNAVGEITGVSYPAAPTGVGNGTSLAIVRDAASGRATKLTWNQAGGLLLASDEVTYTVGGHVKDQKVDGVDHHAGDDFTYDAVGRLTTASVPGQTYNYSFATTASCSSRMGVGRNTNRTSMVVGATTTTYCYDEADRLVSTTDSRYATLAYDARGNTTTLGNETMVYDGANRHVATTKGTTTVRYERDVSNRIIQRQVNGTIVARYAYSASGDTGDATLDGMGNIVEATVPLLGGVLLTVRPAADVWSYPNIHGDVIATANAAGLKQGSTIHYDAYGQPLGALPDNSLGTFDYGWLGRHQRPVETEAGIATIEMGARPYVGGLARFTQPDPVEGGSDNDYEYATGDPINSSDLDGQRCLTGVARRERVRYRTSSGQWKTKTVRHCRSVARGAKRVAATVARGYGRLQRTTEGVARGLIRAGRCAGRAIMILSDAMDLATSTAVIAVGASHADPFITGLGAATFYISYQSYRANARAFPSSCGARME
jgi:RHS repeat-associated protein